MSAEFSSIADIFPLMGEPELRELAEDIRVHGLRESIVLDREGRILDGRNRYRACELVGVAPSFTTFHGLDRVEYVVSLNLKRRHLSESQRAMVATRLATLRQGQGRPEDKPANLPVFTQPEAAEALNLSERTVRTARDVQEHGVPELVDAVDAGRLTVSTAAEVARVDPERQREIVARGEMEILRAAKEIRAERVAERRAAVRARVSEPGAFPAGRFRVLYVDPPWQYENKTLDRYGVAEGHYPTMSTQELCALAVPTMAADESVLFLWATSPLLPDALEVVRAWGFVYKASFVWDKVRHNFGHYNSVRHELLVVATRGTCLPDASDLVDSVQVIERSDRHSEKPAEFRAMIDRLYPHGPRVELFARTAAEGWQVWGNEGEAA